MKKKIELKGAVMQGGKISKQNAAILNSFLKSHEGSIVTITINAGKRRSNPQNRYYWGFVVPFVQQLFSQVGHDLTMNEVHEFLKKEFNAKELEVDGHFLSVPGSSAELNTEEFASYIEKINLFTSNLFGVPVPEPNEQLSIFNDN